MFFVSPLLGADYAHVMYFAPEQAPLSSVVDPDIYDDLLGTGLSYQPCIAGDPHSYTRTLTSRLPQVVFSRSVDLQ